MWERLSHLLQTLTELTSTKVTSKWTDVEQKPFDKIKQIFARNTLLIYPDFNARFDIHTYASDFKLGAEMIQEGKPISLYRRKLTGAQSRYTVTENKLLSIVETLKEFRTIY